jgi:hypothetical protein
MADNSKDLGTMMALLERFAKQTLPKALEIKKRVDRGELLTEWDIYFLHKLLTERVKEVGPLVDRNPEYQEMYAQAVHLCKEITEQALLNEKKSTPPVV